MKKYLTSTNLLYIFICLVGFLLLFQQFGQLSLNQNPPSKAAIASSHPHSLTQTVTHLQKSLKQSGFTAQVSVDKQQILCQISTSNVPDAMQKLAVICKKSSFIVSSISIAVSGQAYQINLKGKPNV